MSIPMENCLDVHITPMSQVSSHATTDEDHRRVQRTPTQAVLDFGGHMHSVRADSLRVQCCNRECSTFIMHSLALLIAILTGLAMMIVRGSGSPEFGLWTGIFSLGIGGFLPNPKIDVPRV